MDKLPQYQEIEDAFKPAAEILDRLPKSTESDRARFHASESYRYAKESRERAGIAERSAEPVTADASVALRLGQETAFTAVQIARAFEEEYIAAVTIAKEEPCED